MTSPQRLLGKARLTWIVALAVVFVFSLHAAAQPIKLEMWHGITGDDRFGIVELVERFNEEYQGRIEVEHTPLNWWPDFYDKTAVAAAAGAAPDIGIMHRDLLPSRALLGILRPIDDLWDRFGLNDDDFLPGIAAETRFEGVRYSVPLDVHSLLLFYNKTHLDEAGIGGPPTNSEEFLDQARKLTRRVGDETERWGTRFGVWGPQFYTLLRQVGGDFFGGDGYREVLIDNEAGQEALNYVYSLMFEQRIAPPYEIWPDPWRNEVSLFIDGIWFLKGAQDNRDIADIHVAPADRVYGDAEQAVWAGSHHFVIFRQPSYDMERLEAAMTFINWMSENSAYWARHGQIPVRLSAIATDVFDELEDHKKIITQRFVFTPHVPWGTGDGIIEEYMRRALDRNYVHHTDIGNAIAFGKAELQTLVERYLTELELE